jgi:hypothetical protein
MVVNVDTGLLSVNANGDLPIANERARLHAEDVILERPIVRIQYRSVLCPWVRFTSTKP